MKLILDLGSGNTCRNDKAIVREMIDSIKAVDTGKHEIILKWQLFESAPPNIPLDRDVFHYAYNYAYAYGDYKTTASVFDDSSLEFLREYDTPFIKIACRPDLYNLIDDLTGMFYVSVNDCLWKPKYSNILLMQCVSKYPATIREYERLFTDEQLESAISDHTVGWDLYNKYKPAVLEKHFVHKREADNPDAGAFAVTAEELKEVML